MGATGEVVWNDLEQAKAAVAAVRSDADNKTWCALLLLFFVIVIIVVVIVIIVVVVFGVCGDILVSLVVLVF
jgi:t-SNARE complex subunit (syntaxin)